MTGSFDFLLRIAIRDMDEYSSLLMNKLSILPDVGEVQSFFGNEGGQTQHRLYHSREKWVILFKFFDCKNAR